jgi:hypothetical protein
MNGSDMSGILALAVFAFMFGWMFAFVFRMWLLGAAISVSVLVIGIIVEYLIHSGRVIIGYKK